MRLDVRDCDCGDSRGRWRRPCPPCLQTVHFQSSNTTQYNTVQHHTMAVLTRLFSLMNNQLDTSSSVLNHQTGDTSRVACCTDSCTTVCTVLSWGGHFCLTNQPCCWCTQGTISPLFSYPKMETTSLLALFPSANKAKRRRKKTSRCGYMRKRGN